VGLDARLTKGSKREFAPYGCCNLKASSINAETFVYQPEPSRLVLRASPCSAVGTKRVKRSPEQIALIVGARPRLTVTRR
jgi:hypothetical protein